MHIEISHFRFVLHPLSFSLSLSCCFSPTLLHLSLHLFETNRKFHLQNGLSFQGLEAQKLPSPNFVRQFYLKMQKPLSLLLLLLLSSCGCIVRICLWLLATSCIKIGNRPRCGWIADNIEHGQFHTWCTPCLPPSSHCSRPQTAPADKQRVPASLGVTWMLALLHAKGHVPAYPLPTACISKGSWLPLRGLPQEVVVSFEYKRQRHWKLNKI